jgi:hypothetical protein
MSQATSHHAHLQSSGVAPPAEPHAQTAPIAHFARGPPLVLIDDVIYPADQAAIFLNRSASSLAKDRVYSRGCPFIRSGRSVGYLGADIRAHRDANRCRSTSDHGQAA